MSAPGLSPSEQPKNKREFNAFLFNIANRFTLEEFKNFTNFAEVLQRALKRKLGRTANEKALDDLIRKNYQNNVPIESKWRRGGFKDLKLTQAFYGSDVAIRIFEQIYGLKKCVVDVDAIQFVDEQQEPSSNDDGVVAEIDLTGTSEQIHHIENPPKRKIKYPRKQQVSGTPSGIATYTSTRKFVDQIPKLQCRAAGLDDKIVVCLTESSIEMVDRPTEIVPNSVKRVEVISNILLVPPTPLRDKANQQQSDHQNKVSLQSSPNIASRPKIGPKSKVRQLTLFREPTIERQPDRPKTVPLQSSPNIASRPKVGPKSRVQQRASRVVYIDEESEELLAQLSATGATNKKSHNFGLKQQPEIGMAGNSPVKSTHDVLQDLLYIDPTPYVSVNEPLQEPPPNMPIPKPRTVLQNFSPNVAVPTAKTRIGPKSVMNRRPEELLENLMHTDPSSETSINKSQTIVFAQPKQKIEPKSLIKSPALMIVPTQLSTTAELLHDLSHTCPLVVQTDDAHVPDETRGPIGQTPPVDVFALSQRESLSKILPVERIGICADNEVPTQCSESSELRNNFMRSLNALIERFPENTSKYLAETDPNALSLKYFFCEFLKSEYESDISAAETQLNSSIVNPDDVHLEAAQSQVVLRQDQLEAENVDNIQMEVESSDADQLEAENVDEIQMKSDSSKVDPLVVDPFKPANVDEIQMGPEPSLTDPQPDQFIEESSDVLLRVKSEHESDGDHNETSSSDVQIIEVPPEEPIEILSDDTQELADNLEVAEKFTQEQLCLPFTMPQLTIVVPSKKKSPAASSSKRFLTSLPVIASKTRNYPALKIVVEAAHTISPTELPMHDFSQQPPTPPSNENYQIEECTMTESQYQRYELLNDANSIFLSSQLENYTGQAPDPKSAIMHTDSTPQPLALKRLSAEALNLQPYKRQRFNETVKRELHLKVMDLKSIAFKPLANNNNIFHLELQLRHNFNTFHVQDQFSIKRMLNLTNNEWNIIVRVLTASNGHRYDSSTTAIERRKLSLPNRITDCFAQSILMFVRSNVHFNDFMGNCLEASVQQPLENKCVDAAMNSTIFKKMGELRKQSNEKNC